MTADNQQQQQQQQQQNQKPWYDGKLDAELVGHMQNRKWDAMPVEEVAINAIKSHKEAERMLGVPRDELVRVPKDIKDEAGWKALHDRLGVPADPKDYDFSTVKTAAGEALDQALADTLRAAAAKAKLPKDAAAAVAAEVQKHLDSTSAAKAAEMTDALNKEKADLAKNWGVNHAANMVVAQAAVKALGIDPSVVAALEKQIGYAKVMDMFRQIGSKIGEDKFVVNNSGGNNGIMTVQQATARKAELENDSEWAKRYMAGGAAENREMSALIRIITGQQG